MKRTYTPEDKDLVFELWKLGEGFSAISYDTCNKPIGSWVLSFDVQRAY